MEASILLSKCPHSHQLFGMRIERRANDWVRTWAFPISAHSAAVEGFYDNNITGSFECDDEYPGCPFCGSMSIVMCGNCGKVTCRNEGEFQFTCEWCGVHSKLREVEVLTVQGEQF